VTKSQLASRPAVLPPTPAVIGPHRNEAFFGGDYFQPFLAQIAINGSVLCQMRDGKLND
jgi:hypothetical protein